MPIISDTGWNSRETGRCYVEGNRLIITESSDEAEPSAIGHALTTGPVAPAGQECRFKVTKQHEVTRHYKDGSKHHRAIYAIDLYYCCDSSD